MPNPWERYAAPAPAAGPWQGYVVAQTPAQGPKAPSGFKATDSGLAPIAGGPEDIGYTARKAAAEAAARAGASTPIETAAQMRLIGARTAAEVTAAQQKAAIDNAASMAKMQQEREFKLQQTPQQRAMASLDNDDVLGAIQQARDTLNSGHAAGLAGQVFGRFGGTNATDLAGTLNTIKGHLTLDNLQKLKAASTSGASGMGSLTEKEGELLASTVASLDQRQSSEKLADSLAKIEDHYRRWNALNSGQNPDDPAVQKSFGLVTAAPGASQGGDGGPSSGSPMGLSQDGTQTVSDPTLAGVNGKIASLIKGGASGDDVRGYLETIRPGLGAGVANIDQWVRFHAQNPKAPIAVNVESRQVPLSPIRGLVNTAAQSPVGAYGLSVADAATMGTLDNMTANPTLARAGMSAVQGRNPLSSIAGMVTGSALANAGIEAGLGGLGVKAAARPVVSDLLYGAGYGAGSADDGDRLAGAGLGAVSSVGGGMFGRKAVAIGGRALAGVADKGLRTLRDADIPMTLGMVAGGRLKSIEDRLAGFPVVGNAIQARRADAYTALNRKAFDDALEPIKATTAGMVGEQGVSRALGAVGTAYDNALGGVNVSADAPYRTAMGQLTQRVPTIPRVGPELASAMDATIAPMFTGADLSGRSMQAIDRGLQQLKGSYKNDPLYATHIAPAINDAGTNVAGLFQRQAPDVIPGYEAAKAAFGRTVTLEDAVLAAKNTGGVFSPAQLTQADVKNTTRYGGKHAAASGDRPFFDLSRAAQDNLPSQVPDSGTAGRMLLPMLAAGIGGGGGAAAGGDGNRTEGGLTGALALGALAAAPYSAPVQSALTKALLAERPAAARKAGEALLKRKRLGGMFGNSLALQYAFPSY